MKEYWNLDHLKQAPSEPRFGFSGDLSGALTRVEPKPDKGTVHYTARCLSPNKLNRERDGDWTLCPTTSTVLPQF